MITIKTKEDIAILREGGLRHAKIMKQLASIVRPGISARELNDMAMELISFSGGRSAFLNYKPYGANRPYPAALCVSVNDEVVHGIPNESDKILKDGDIVSIDLGLVHKKMFTDMALTLAVGKVTPELKKLLRVTKDALMAGVKAAKGGNRIGDVGFAIQAYADKNNYGIVEELAGHGVGYSVHEDPYVPNYGEAGKGELLKPRMVIAIEPMFNLGTKKVTLDADGYTYRTVDGKPSAHFEHTVLITTGEAEILTKS